MAITVNEAAELTCPEISTPERQHTCEGHKCMWWQWHVTVYKKDDLLEQTKISKTHGMCGAVAR